MTNRQTNRPNQVLYPSLRLRAEVIIGAKLAKLNTLKNFKKSKSLNFVRVNNCYLKVVSPARLSRKRRESGVVELCSTFMAFSSECDDTSAVPPHAGKKGRLWGVGAIMEDIQDLSTAIDEIAKQLG